MSTVTRAIEQIGLSRLARRFGYYPSAIQSWRDDGRLPKSELAGLTHYAEVIAEMTEGEFTADQLREDTREAWMRDQSKKRAPK